MLYYHGMNDNVIPTRSVGTKDGLSVLITELSKLPGIGAKSAERLAFHILRMPEKERTHLARIIHSVKDLRLCQNC
ncbi:MAG: hypothetical protein HY762_04515, partial [Planctomycetes bacterium]|nr:hypothetical protein [Planctomycetota bacterium]